MAIRWLLSGVCGQSPTRLKPLCSRARPTEFQAFSPTVPASILVGVVVGQRVTVREIVAGSVVPIRPSVVERITVAIVIVGIVKARKEKESVDQLSETEKQQQAEQEKRHELHPQCKMTAERRRNRNCRWQRSNSTGDWIIKGPIGSLKGW